MKKIISLLMALTLLVGCVATLSSCGEEEGGAEIAVYLGNEVYDLDPSDYFVNDNAAQFMSLLFEPLFSLDEDGDLEMAAAEDYEIDEEDTSFSFSDVVKGSVDAASSVIGKVEDIKSITKEDIPAEDLITGLTGM